MKKRFNSEGEAQGFRFSFGVRHNAGRSLAYLELDDTIGLGGTGASIEASDHSIEGLEAKVDAALRRLKIPQGDRKIVQVEIFEEVVTPALRGQL